MSSAIVQALNVYPIKSTAGISLSSSWVDDFGLSFDRRFVVTDLQGQFITARTEPRLCLIQSNITAHGLMLTAPKMPILAVEYQHFSTQYQSVTVWGDDINGQRCTTKIDQWFSQFLSKPCKLLYFGEQSKRFIKNKKTQVGFADGYPLLLIAQASLEDVNLRMNNHQITMAQFRPNIVINNCAAFAEDTWRHIRIGEVEFELTKPCSRCIFTTIDPKTAEKHGEQEPLNTLKSYRQVEGGDVMFGQNLVQLNQGQINIGDTIEVLDTQKPPLFKLPSTAQQTSKISTPILPSHAIDNHSELTLICDKIIDETHDVKTFIFKNTSGGIIHYIAGQHLPITFSVDGKSVKRNYTLSSSPSRIGYVSITVKRVANGKISNFLHDDFAVGDHIQAAQPSGNFHSNSADLSKVLLLSAGSGITPMLSLLKVMTDHALHNDIVFLHSARAEKDLIAKDEISALALQHNNCQISYTLTQNASPQWQDYQGHLSERMLTNVNNLTQRQVFVCGPSGFRESARVMLEKLGLPTQQFHFESFGQDLRSAENQDIAAQENEAKSIPTKVNILFDSWDTFYQGNTTDTLLEQGEEAGLILPYSCRGGMCGSCRVKLESGEVKQLASDGLTDAEKEQGYILACSCIPLSDVVINAD